MATLKEKQLAILLLKERLERETGKRVVLKENNLSSLGNITNQLDKLGVKYELNNDNKIQPFKVIYKPINKSDEFYDKFNEIIYLNNLYSVVKTSLKEEAALALNNDNYTPVEALSDKNEPRPNRMKKPGELPNYWILLSRNRSGLYIQDECREMMIDKYGLKGEKVWEGLIDAGTGPFFQFATKVAAEKAWLVNELGLQPCHGDYWKYSYFDMWKEWMKRIGQSINIKQPETNIPQTAIKPTIDVQPTTTPVVQPTKPVSSIKSTIKPDSKDEMRINDIATKTNNNPIKMKKVAQVMANKITDGKKAYRRGLAAEDENYHDLAKIFFDRARQLGVR